MKKTLKKIFSENISSKFSDYKTEHNKLVIEKLINEKDEEKRKYFNKLFNLSFYECFHHFVGKKEIDVLIGLKLFEQMIEDKKELEKKKIDINEKNYIENLKEIFENCENILNRKKSRKKKKNIDDASA